MSGTRRMVQQQHACGAGCGCGRHGKPTVDETMAGARRTLAAAHEKLDTMGAQDRGAAFEREIEREVVAQRVIATLDAESGAVRVYAPPDGLGDGAPASSGPLARAVATPGTSTLSPERRAQLEDELQWQQAIVDDRMSSPGYRRMAQIEVDKIKRLLALPPTAGSSASDQGRGTAQPSVEDELAELKDEMTQLLKLINASGTAADDRAHAQARLDQVRQSIADKGRHVPVSKA